MSTQMFGVRNVPVDLILPSERNPRRELRHVEELAESIREYGLLQPIVVRRGGDGHYEIVAGHRRFAAVQALGWPEVPAIEREADGNEAYVLALIENLQRDDLTAKEEAEGLEALVRERDSTTGCRLSTAARGRFTSS